MRRRGGMARRVTRPLLQVGLEELLELVERDLACLVIVEIRMVGARYHDQLFLLAAHGLEGIFGKVARVGILAGDDKRGMSISPA